MKFINVIREGDFVRLKTLSQLEKEFGKAEKSVNIDTLFFGDSKKGFFVHKNERKELGNVLRIKKVQNAELSDNIFFQAEDNGIFYNYDDIEGISFEKHIVDAVLINGKWYQADMDLNALILTQ